MAKSRKTKERQTSQWPRAVIQRKANITMARSRKPNKGKHYNGQKPSTKERQTSQWPKVVNQRKTNITMAKSRKPKKGKHHNGQKP